jgi:predicted porin
LTLNGAGKLTNNQLFAGVSYRFGNWEPRVSATWSSDLDGSNVQQLGSRQWTLNTGYYLSKRTQVYGLISNLNNSANQDYNFGQATVGLGSQTQARGSNMFTYGAGLRTTF